MKTILETERFYLREFTESDYKDLSEILQDEDVMYAWEHSLIWCKE
jgi:RimJ/RimL family protein N-acetyltransferase